MSQVLHQPHVMDPVRIRGLAARRHHLHVRPGAVPSAHRELLPSLRRPCAPTIRTCREEARPGRASSLKRALHGTVLSDR